MSPPPPRWTCTDPGRGGLFSGALIESTGVAKEGAPHIPAQRGLVCPRDKTGSVAVVSEDDPPFEPIGPGVMESSDILCGHRSRSRQSGVGRVVPRGSAAAG